MLENKQKPKNIPFGHFCSGGGGEQLLGERGTKMVHLQTTKEGCGKEETTDLVTS